MTGRKNGVDRLMCICMKKRGQCHYQCQFIKARVREMEKKKVTRVIW